MENFIVPNDLYLIPSDEDENYILYRPSKYLIALLNPEMTSKLSTLLKEDRKKSFNNSYDIKNLSSLVEIGFLDSSNDVKSSNKSKVTDSCSIVHHIPNTKLFLPHEVTLDITRKCNMRCIYCYSCGGDTKISMSRDCGISAIDFCISNAKRKGIFFGLHFHGGGEPSQEFSLLKEFHDYAKNRCSENDVQFKCSVITNGLISSEIVNFYAESMDEITLSLDGDQISHDLQRTSINGGATFINVYKTGKRLLNLKKKFNLRTTVTSKNVKRLDTIVDFFINEFPNCSINIEPVTLVGRALGSDNLACDSIFFADQLFSSMKKAIKSGATLFYSGVSGHSQRKMFCAASAPNFCVCADGSVTSCFSYSNRDIVRDLFVYGRFDELNKKFNYNTDRIKRLQSLSMEHDDYCDRCFCRTHCIGDCPAIRTFELNEVSEFVEKLDTDFMHNRRCATNRRIVTLLLNEIVRGRMGDSILRSGLDIGTHECIKSQSDHTINAI
ncbi:MAG: 4Fe-4S cluster-binding domain-containing protein [Candidatus Delongbacteria bacterium]|nr:4Fe-4S cluster-binding domain-containing protein [Candidatus Delongbacteria bacterium]